MDRRCLRTVEGVWRVKMLGFAAVENSQDLSFRVKST
jgi:hypothetical protein